MSAISRFLGGSPVAVLVKLAVVSLLVGWLLHWLDWTPGEVWRWAQGLALGAWASLGDFAEYILLGAAVVVPVFLVMRLLAYRGSRP